MKDKTQWAVGPWTTEPDRSEFQHAGLACLLLRNDFGVWCGYAGVPAVHPWYGKTYNADEVNVSIHGGLTYSDTGRVPVEPGEPELWWFGFDCGHCFDLVPGLINLVHGLTEPEIYRDISYARRETEHLAEQLAYVYSQQAKQNPDTERVQ